MKKTVQFGTDERVQTFEVESLRDEISIWWTRQEVREIEDETETLLHFMNQNMNKNEKYNATYNDSNQRPVEIDHTIHSTRGLEKRTEIGAWQVYEVQRDARNAVLNQQDKHRKSKSPLFMNNKGSNRTSSSTFNQSSVQRIIDMQMAIADVYHIATLNARRAAYEVGLKDQLEARHCHEMEAITSTFIQQQQTQSPPLPLVRQLSKTIILTSEPINIKNRRISQHLIDPLPLPVSNDCNVDVSDGAEPSPSLTVHEKMLCNVSSNSHASERIGMAPRPRSFITPMKKRRPKVNLEKTTVVAPTTPQECHVELVDDGTKFVVTPRRKRLDELLTHLDMLHKKQDTASELTDNDAVTPTRPKKTVPKKKVDSTVTELTDNVVVTPPRRKKTVTKKKVDDSVVLDDKLLQILQENTIVVTKKKKKKKPLILSSSDNNNTGNDGKKEHRQERKSPKRTTSRDSSKGNVTAATELMLDNSSNSFDDSFALFEFHSGNNSNNDENGYNECCKNFFDHTQASKAIVSLQDSFITI